LVPILYLLIFLLQSKTSVNISFFSILFILLEAALDEAFSSSVSSTTKRVVDILPHLYGELTKTAMGCKVFDDFNHFPDLVADIVSVSRPALLRRAALWAVVRSPVFGFTGNLDGPLTRTSPFRVLFFL